MKIKQKFIAGAVVMALACTCSAMTVSAANVHLYANQTVAKSAEVYGSWKKISGSNSLSSAYSVYFTAKQNIGGIFYSDVQRLVASGKSLPSTNTSTAGSEHFWRLDLNPEGANRMSCIADGLILND